MVLYPEFLSLPALCPLNAYFDKLGKTGQRTSVHGLKGKWQRDPRPCWDQDGDLEPAQPPVFCPRDAALTFHLWGDFHCRKLMVGEGQGSRGWPGRQAGSPRSSDTPLASLCVRPQGLSPGLPIHTVSTNPQTLASKNQIYPQYLRPRLGPHLEKLPYSPRWHFQED